MSFLDGLLGSPNYTQASTSSVSASAGVAIFITAPAITRQRSGQFRLNAAVSGTLSGSTTGGIAVQFFSSLTGAVGPSVVGVGTGGSASASAIWIDQPTLLVGESISYSAKIQPTNPSTSLTLTNNGSAIVCIEEGGAPSGSGAVTIATSGSGGGGGGGGGGGTLTTAPFTMPAVGSTVTPVAVQSGAAVAQGYSVGVLVAGLPSYMTVTLVSGNNLTLLNNGGPTNVIPTTSVASGSSVTVASTNAPIGAAAPGFGTSLLVDSTGTYQNVGVSQVVSVRTAQGATPGAVGNASLGTYGSGTDDHAAFVAADAAALSSGRELYIPKGVYRLATQLRFTSRVIFGVGAVLQPDLDATIGTTWTVAIIFSSNCSPPSHYQQIFAPRTKVYFNFNNGSGGQTLGYLHETHFRWWGAGDSVTDDTWAVRACLFAACTFANGGGIANLGANRIRITDAVDLENLVTAQLTTTWSASMAYAAAHAVMPTAPNATGYYYVPCALTSDTTLTNVTRTVGTSMGTAAGSEPTWPTLAQSVVLDNATYMRRGGLLPPVIPAGCIFIPAGITIKGVCGESTGSSFATQFFVDFNNSTADPSGTGGSIDNAGNLSGLTGHSWDPSDLGSYIHLGNSGQFQVLGFGTSPPVLTITPTNAQLNANTQIQVQILTEGQTGTATFQYRTKFTNYAGPFTTSSTGVTLTGALAGCVFTWPAAQQFYKQGSLVSTGTSPPVCSLSGSPTGNWQVIVAVDSVAGGTGLGQATGHYTVYNDLTNFTTAFTTASTVVLNDPNGTATGYTLNMAAGPYHADNVYTAQPMTSYTAQTMSGAWQVDTINSTSSVHLKDPTTQFTISSSNLPSGDAGLAGGISWVRPRQCAALRVWSSQCVVEGLTFRPSGVATVIYGGWETAWTPTTKSVQTQCTFARCSVNPVIGHFIHGWSNGENPTVPGTGQRVGNGDYNRYVRCSTPVGASMFSFHDPNIDGQNYEIQFDGCDLAQQGSVNGRACAYTVSGTYRFVNSCTFSSSNLGLFIGASGNTLRDSLSEGLARLVMQPNVSSNPLSLSIGGRVAPDSTHPDGRFAILRGALAAHMDSLACDPIFDSHFCLDVNNGGVATAMSCTSSFFPNVTPMFYPPNPGNVGKLSMRGCYGSNNVGAAIALVDVNGVTYG